MSLYEWGRRLTGVVLVEEEGRLPVARELARVQGLELVDELVVEDQLLRLGLGRQRRLGQVLQVRPHERAHCRIKRSVPSASLIRSLVSIRS